MTAAILEIRDGIATGPLHQPVPQRLIGKNLWQRFDEVEPLEWPTVCGTTGYVYQRAGLAELGHTSQCFQCAVIALTPPKVRRPEDPATLKERHKRHRGKCQDCGGPTSWTSRQRPIKRCRECHLISVRAVHGTRARYQAGCRCDWCRWAQAADQRDRRARKKAA